jgi:hypothetical protein
VLDYLGRYTHRVAIANSRLVGLAAGRVSFIATTIQKVMTLGADEFIRRFLLHVLPDGFHRIRHYGYLANGGLGIEEVRAYHSLGGAWLVVVAHQPGFLRVAVLLRCDAGAARGIRPHHQCQGTTKAAGSAMRSRIMLLRTPGWGRAI